MPKHNEKNLSNEEIFELAQTRFLASSKLTGDAIEAACEFNKELHTLTTDQLFKQFTM